MLYRNKIWKILFIAFFSTSTTAVTSYSLLSALIPFFSSSLFSLGFYLLNCLFFTKILSFFPRTASKSCHWALLQSRYPTSSFVDDPHSTPHKFSSPHSVIQYNFPVVAYSWLGWPTTIYFDTKAQVYCFFYYGLLPYLYKLMSYRCSCFVAVVSMLVRILIQSSLKMGCEGLACGVEELNLGVIILGWISLMGFGEGVMILDLFLFCGFLFRIYLVLVFVLI